MKQREIKFRWWNTLLKKMFGPEDLFELTDCRDESKWGSWIIPEHTVIMQFTGLKDKNGKDIYEGDVMQSEVWGVLDIVWANDSASFGCRHPITGMHMNLLGHESAEVIGNIHENPELLKP